MLLVHVIPNHRILTLASVWYKTHVVAVGCRNYFCSTQRNKQRLSWWHMREIGIGAHPSTGSFTTLCGSLLQEDALQLPFWVELLGGTKEPPCCVPPRSTPKHHNQPDWRRAFNTRPPYRCERGRNAVDCYLESKLTAMDARNDGHREARCFAVVVDCLAV